MILGLTGNVGSGKSTVAEMLRDLAGAIIIDADAITHDLQRPGQPGYTAIVQAFGTGILNADNTINRPALGHIVFNDPAQLARLNAILHPLVRAEETRLLSQHAGAPLIVLMVPLLFEVGMQSMVDKVLAVTLSLSHRLQRLAASRGLTPEQVLARLQQQMPEDEKAQRADFVISNDGTLDETRDRVKELLKTLGLKIFASPPTVQHTQNS